MDETIDIEKVYEECRYWQEKMGLSHWDIEFFTVEGEEPDEDAKWDNLASCDANSMYKIAKVYFNEGVINSGRIKDKDITKAIVHELLHCIFTEMQEYVEQNIDGNTRRYHTYYLERVISHLSHFIIVEEQDNSNYVITHNSADGREEDG